MAAVVREVIDACRCAVADVQSNDGGPKQSGQMMRDKSIAASNVKNVSSRWQRARHFQRHIVGAAHLASPSHALETALDECA